MSVPEIIDSMGREWHADDDSVHHWGWSDEAASDPYRTGTRRDAIGLWIASLILDDDMSLSGAALVIAVVIFTVLMLVLDPLVSRRAEKYADFLTGGSALASTALALLLTEWISDGLSMDGIGTWILTTVLVWIVTAIVGVLLGCFVLQNHATWRSPSDVACGASAVGLVGVPTRMTLPSPGPVASGSGPSSTRPVGRPRSPAATRSASGHRDGRRCR